MRVCLFVSHVSKTEGALKCNIMKCANTAGANHFKISPGQIGNLSTHPITVAAAAVKDAR